MTIRRDVVRFQDQSGWRNALLIFCGGTACALLALLMLVVVFLQGDSTNGYRQNLGLFFAFLIPLFITCDWGTICCVLSLKALARLNAASMDLCETLSERSVGRASDRLAFCADVARAPVQFSIYGFVVQNGALASFVSGLVLSVLGVILNLFLGFG